MLKKAFSLHQKGQLDEAAALYRKILKQYPRNADALYLLGVMELQKANPLAAIEWIDRAIAIRPDNAEFFYNRGNALGTLERFDDALASYDRALAIKPDYAAAFYDRGNALRDLKRFDDALASYDRALAIQPHYADAFNNRGIALAGLKRFDEALASYERALALQPDYAEAFYNRGVVLADLRRQDDALASYDHALAIRPDWADAFIKRGNALMELKRVDEALVSYEHAIALNPSHAEAVYNRARALKKLRRYGEALASYDRAIGLEPGYAEAFNNRGNVLKALGRLEEAVASYDRAAALRPGYAEAFINRGIVLRDLNRPDDAIASYDRALALLPDHPDALNNRGVALADMNRPDEAIASYDRALALQPDYANALNNRGNALRDKKHLDEAIATYDRALAVKPDFAEVIYNRGMTRLLGAHFREGWADYEYRWNLMDAPTKSPQIDTPKWQGENIEGRSILVFAEQGLGDIIQFARYLPLLLQHGASVSFFGPAKLMRLLRPMGAQIEFISSLDTRKSFDFRCALMSLPLRFGTDLKSIPNQVPYLKAEEILAARWGQIIGEAGFKIGIAWRGNPQGKVDRGRSFPLSGLASLSRLPGVRLISLQKHHGLDQLANLPAGTHVEILAEDFDSGPDAFIDTAAIMSHLDLIITSDTSIAHLAGALGRPAWVALKYVPDWRWLLDRADSPWYPTARLFRQKTAGDWTSVFFAMEQELCSLLGIDNIKRPMNEADRKQEAADGSVAADRRALMESANLRLKRCKHGAMMFHAHDEYIGRSLDLYGEFSEGEMELFNNFLRPGMTVVDIGANIGVHTVYFARAVGPSGQVFAFEPQRILYQILCGNVALNGHHNVVALNAGLGAQSGNILVPRVDYTRRGNFGGLSLGKWEKGDQVPLRTLDSCGVKACHLIKIDVEGMELAVLEGARSVLDEHKPLLYVENDREENSKALIAWLLDRGYRLYWHMPRMFNAKNYFGETQNVFGSIGSINMLCIPGEMAASVGALREITSPDADWRNP